MITKSRIPIRWTAALALNLALSAVGLAQEQAQRTAFDLPR